MQVKGAVVHTIPLFIKKRFGEQGYERWLESLSESVNTTFSTIILKNAWFPLGAGVVEPTLRLCELFYDGDLSGAAEQGRFSAECGIQSVFGFSVTTVSPQFIVSRAGEILQSYYQPCTIEVVETKPTSATVRITRFDSPYAVVEQRIRGWAERALEISGAKAPEVRITESMTTGSAYTELTASWN